MYRAFIFLFPSHQHAANMHSKHRKSLSYGHFLYKTNSDQVVPNDCSSSSDECTKSISHQPPLTATPLVNYDPHFFDSELNPKTPNHTQVHSTEIPFLLHVKSDINTSYHRLQS